MSISKDVVSRIDEDEVISLASELVAHKSVSGQERSAVMFVADLMRREGFEVEIQEVEPGRPQMIARLRGSGGGASMMLNGHLDIDPAHLNAPSGPDNTPDETDPTHNNPFAAVRDGNRLWGAGIHNMKSGVAAMISAALAIQRSDIELRGDLVVAAVVGELQGGKGTVHMLNSGVVTDYAIVPEPYSVKNIITRCVGVHKFAVTTYGKTVHISHRQNGVDAIEKMVGRGGVRDTLLNLKLDDGDSEIPGTPLVNCASIIGGRNDDYDLTGPSHLADKCTAIFDLRYAGDYSPQDIDAILIAQLDQLMEADPTLKVQLDHPPPKSFNVGGTDMPPMNLSPDNLLVRALTTKHLEISGQPIEGTGAVLPYSYCGNDTAHLQRAGINCCLYGPRGYSDYVEQHVRIDEMLTCSRVITATTIELCS